MPGLFFTTDDRQDTTFKKEFCLFNRWRGWVIPITGSFYSHYQMRGSASQPLRFRRTADPSGIMEINQGRRN
jgi:hypothetical protein